MTDNDSVSEPVLAAGDFSAWLLQIRVALRGEASSDVPCGTCTACCTSSQFVHVGPEEADALAHIPPELLFPAPGPRAAHLLLGYNERGHCPLLIDNRCSIYEHRPRACRTYDCRVFPAAGVEDTDPAKARITARARRWRFTDPSGVDALQHDAVRAAARYIDNHPDLLPAQVLPTNPTQRAVLAIEIHEAFIGHDVPTGKARMIEDPDPATVKAALASALTPRTR